MSELQHFSYHVTVDLPQLKNDAFGKAAKEILQKAGLENVSDLWEDVSRLLCDMITKEIFDARQRAVYNSLPLRHKLQEDVARELLSKPPARQMISTNSTAAPVASDALVAEIPHSDEGPIGETELQKAFSEAWKM